MQINCPERNIFHSTCKGRKEMFHEVCVCVGGGSTIDCADTVPTEEGCLKETLSDRTKFVLCESTVLKGTFS